MLSLRNNNSTSSQVYADALGKARTFVLIGQGLVKRNVFENGHYNNNKVANMRLGVYWQGIGHQDINLPADYQLPKGIKDLSRISLINPRAKRYKSRIFVYADGIREAGAR